MSNKCPQYPSPFCLVFGVFAMALRICILAFCLSRHVPLLADEPANLPPPPMKWPCDSTVAAVSQKSWAAHLKMEPVIENSVGMPMALIPPGTFLMGSPKSEKGRDQNEQQVETTITKPFRIASTELTQGAWMKVVGRDLWRKLNPQFATTKLGPGEPATRLTWDDAQEFCRELSKQEGRTYRLPTEAEWEWSCRAGSDKAYCYGDDPDELPKYAWYGSFWGKTGTARTEPWPHRPALKAPNAFQLFDVHGNVREWCQDIYSEQLPGGVDPVVTEGEDLFVLRSGAFPVAPNVCRCAFRTRSDREARDDSNTIRVVLELPVEK